MTHETRHFVKKQGYFESLFEIYFDGTLVAPQNTAPSPSHLSS